MNLHERGTRLATVIASTIGLLAVVAASALGLHEWADNEATSVSRTDTSTGTATTDAGSDSAGSTSTGSDSASSSSGSAVSPATGSTSDATSSGS